MAHKFHVGEFVDFKPAGSKKVGRFQIQKLLPEEFRAADWRYRIKGDQEDFERTVFEWDLSPSLVPRADVYETTELRRRAASRE